MDKWKSLYLKTSGFGLQAAALFAAFFAMDTDGGSLLLAVPLAIASLLIYGRGARATPDPVPPVTPPRREEQPRLEEMILTLQEDVNRLREDREFFRELYVEKALGQKELQERSRI